MEKNKRFIWVLLAGLAIFVVVPILAFRIIGIKKTGKQEFTTPSASPSATPTTSFSATPRPLTFAEMNKLYGPCTNLPVLMYHHVEPEENAKLNKRTGLNVPPEMFKKQMEYLVSKGYSTVFPSDLANFFDSGTPLPSKPVMITLDDGYVDNGDLMFPILRQLGLKVTIYLATGLMENFNYLTWAKIDEMKTSGFVSFGNHTWSHKNVGGAHDVVLKEISTADEQLADRGLNSVKTFVYPYGLDTAYGEKVLKDLGYKLAFTEVHGRIQCKQKRLSLPRIRIGNSLMAGYGL